MELLERENFFALLSEYAGDAKGGDSRVVLIAGEAGLGKMALVEALQHRQSTGRWFWGRVTAHSRRSRSRRCCTSPVSSAAS